MHHKVWTAFGVLFVAAASFYGGTQWMTWYGALASPASLQPPAGSAAQSATSLFGTVQSNQAGILTVKLQDNSIKTIITSSSTSVTSAPQPASAQAIKNGSTVSVVGLMQSDGSVAAQAVQIVPPPALSGAAQ